MAPPPANVFRIPGLSHSPTGALGVRPGVSWQQWVPWSPHSAYFGNTASRTAHAGNVSLPPNYLLTYDGNRRSEIARLVMQLLGSMQIAHESAGRARANAYSDAMRALSAINQLVSDARGVAANLDGEVLRAAELHRRLTAQMLEDKYSLDARQVAADLFALYPRTAAAEQLALLMDALEKGSDVAVPVFVYSQSSAMYRSGSLMVRRRDEPSQPQPYANADPLASEAYEVPLMMAAGGSGTVNIVGQSPVYYGAEVGGVTVAEVISTPSEADLDAMLADAAAAAAAAANTNATVNAAPVQAEALSDEVVLQRLNRLLSEAEQILEEASRAITPAAVSGPEREARDEAVARLSRRWYGWVARIMYELDALEGSIADESREAFRPLVDYIPYPLALNIPRALRALGSGERFHPIEDRRTISVGSSDFAINLTAVRAIVAEHLFARIERAVGPAAIDDGTVLFRPPARTFQYSTPDNPVWTNMLHVLGWTRVDTEADVEAGAIRIRIPEAAFIDLPMVSSAPISAAAGLVGHRERLAAIAAEGSALTFEARLFFTKVLFDEAGLMEAEFQGALRAVMDLERSDAAGARIEAKERARQLVAGFDSWVLAYRNAWHMLLDGMISHRLADNIMSQLEGDPSLDAAREGLHRAALAESIMQELRSVALQIPNNIGLALLVITNRTARDRTLTGSETLQVDLARGTHRRLTVDGRNHLTLDVPHEFAEFAAKLIEFVTSGAVRIRRPLHELVVDAAMADHRDPPAGSLFSAVGSPPDKDALAFRVLRYITGWEVEPEGHGAIVSWHLGFETSSPERGAAGLDPSAAVCEAPSPQQAVAVPPIAATLSAEALSAMNVDFVRAYVSSLPPQSRLDVALMLVSEADAMRTRVAHDVHAAIARGSGGLPDHDAYDAAVTAWSAWRRWYDAVTDGLEAAMGREPTDLLIGDLLSSIVQPVGGGGLLFSVQRLLASEAHFAQARKWLALIAQNPLRTVECRGMVVCQTTWARKEVARTLLENLSMSGGQQRRVTMRRDGNWFIIETYGEIDPSHAIGSLYRGMQWPYDPQNPELKVILNLLGWEMVVEHNGDRVTYRINLGRTRIE